MTRRIDLDLGEGQPLVVRCGDLPVEVRGEEIARAFLEAPGSDDPAARATVEVENEGGRLVVTALPATGSGEQVLSVHLPRARREVAIESGAGRVLIEGLAGSIRANSTSGRVELRSSEGELSVVCANGSVEARGVRGSLDASTANGRITVSESSLTEGSLKSGNGPIAVQLRPEGKGNLAIFAGDGRVELALPEDAGFRIKVRTRDRLDNHFQSYSVSSEAESTVVESGGGDFAVFIQAAKAVRLVKYEEFAAERDEGPLQGPDVEDLEELFGRLAGCFGGGPRRFDFADEIPRIARRMQAVGARFGRMGEEFSRRFHEARAAAGGAAQEREVAMVLDLLKEGRVSVEEAERLINAVRSR